MNFKASWELRESKNKLSIIVGRIDLAKILLKKWASTAPYHVSAVEQVIQCLDEAKDATKRLSTMVPIPSSLTHDENTVFIVPPPGNETFERDERRHEIA